MAPPSFNANGIPVVHGSYVSGNTTSLNHSINDAHIADAITQKQQQDVDERMSYYESSNTFGKPSSMNLESGGGVGTIPRGACRDTFWAILFYAHLLGIGVATLKYSPLMTNDLVTEYAQGAYRRFLSEGSSHGWFSWEDGSDERGHRYLDNEEEDFVLEMSTMWTVLMFSGLASILISSLAMSLIMAIPTAMIKIALAFNLLVTTAVCVFAIVVGAIVVGVIAGIGLVLTVYYTYIVWRRIPFAASTLVTALTAVKCNVGLAFFAYNNLVVTFLWALWWATAFVATTYVMGDCNAEGYCENEINGFIVFLFLVSFFWTFQVIKNVVHVTVAGTVGTWWFVPGEARSCCSSAVRNSYWRSITTSFGSICFGSLLVAIIQATREIVYSMRTQENSLLLCLIDCILSIIERIAKYFNKWAYIYVGLYGYGFIEASTNVLSVSDVESNLYSIPMTGTTLFSQTIRNALTF